MGTVARKERRDWWKRLERESKTIHRREKSRSLALAGEGGGRPSSGGSLDLRKGKDERESINRKDHREAEGGLVGVTVLAGRRLYLLGTRKRGTVSGEKKRAPAEAKKRAKFSIRVGVAWYVLSGVLLAVLQH